MLKDGVGVRHMARRQLEAGEPLAEQLCHVATMPCPLFCQTSVAQSSSMGHVGVVQYFTDTAAFKAVLTSTNHC